MPGLHLHKTTPNYTSMPSKITNKNETASTRSQLNVPKKVWFNLSNSQSWCEFFRTHQEKVLHHRPQNEAQHNTPLICSFQRSTSLQNHTQSLQDVWFSSFPLKESMASHWGQVAWITCTGGSLVPAPPAVFCTCCHHMSHMALFPPHEHNKQREKVDMHGHCG